MRLADIESGLVTEAMGKTITETFHRTMYDIQRGTGAGFAFTAPDTQAVREILSNPWSGQHFSERIWKNGAALADELNEKLTADFLTGRSAARAAQEIATDFGVRYREAERLVRTETCYMANAAEMASYAECGMDKYRYVATLDKITSPPCRKLDGKVFYVKDAMPGENCPPMHPNCRSTTIGVLDDDAMAEMTRKAQDPITGEFVDVPATMNYEEWQALQEVHYGKERMALLQRMTANKAADREQYGRYKKLLGEGNVPESFAKFQKMKYNNIKEWNEQKALYRDVNWQVKAQEKITKGAAHTVPNEGEPSSVFDNYGEDGELLARRYYGVTGKKRLDIDLSAHGNPKKHPIVPHAHTISEETGVREHKGRELSKAERIANKDILKE